ncbi:MAG: T9SS type A sorting domain-containing protein [Bacteroidota bacterium]
MRLAGHALLGLLAASLLAAPLLAIAQPRPDLDGVSVREAAAVPQTNDEHPIRIARNPADGALYVLATSNPGGTGATTSTIYRLDAQAGETFDLVPVLTHNAHGTPRAVGMAFGPDGSFYLVGNAEAGDDRTRLVVRRGTPVGTSWRWATVATSEPYRLSRTWFDHRANAVAVTPDGSTLIVNSGARTDHGEMYGGVREEGLTAILLQIPAAARDLVLPNDREALRADGYLFAEGIRNTADLAFAPNGDLFGPENAGDRDDSEELNWLREGRHYGFPWRIGTSTTPMQFPGYDPAADPFVSPARNLDNEADTGWYFSDDPTFPAPPDGVAFTEPIPNVGPDADRYRDPVTGALLDASDTGTAAGTFTAHRSPLGLVFDADSALAAPLTGSAFVLSFNGPGDSLLDRMGGGGNDLLALDLEAGPGGYTLSATLVASGFDHPVDAAMGDGVLYVIEYGNWFGPGGSRSVQAVTLPRRATASEPLPDAPDLALAVAPNPARDAVTLRVTLDRPVHARLDVLDVLGRTVLRAPLSATTGTQVLPVSVRGFPSGVYVARLVTEDGVATRSFTVQ